MMVSRHLIALAVALAFAWGAAAQVVVEDEYDHFYNKDIPKQRRPEPLPFVRESDVVWETTIWRTIDLRAKFNQCFYYPVQPEGVHGRKNFAYMLWQAINNDQLQLYRDDDLKIPLDNQFFVKQMTKGDTLQLEIIDDDENYEYKTVIVPHEFNSENVLQIYLKEAWYIDRQSTQQWIRIIALGIGQTKFRHVGDEQVFVGIVPLFWIPMLSSDVRTLLHQHEAYYEDNIAQLPSWLQIIDSRRFESFITRESNRFNRPIMSYLTGVDALLEAEKIENKLLDISLDMWEY